MYKKDYEKSRKYELDFEKKLQQKYNLLTEHTDEEKYFPYWDISSTATTTNRVITFEVKYTGTKDKIYIEDGQMVDGKFKPTCLKLTTAEYYVFGDDNEPVYHLIKTDKIREFCYEKTNQKHRELFWDKNNYRLFIFEKEFIYTHSIKIQK